MKLLSENFQEFADFLNEAVNVNSLVKKNVKAMNKIIAKHGYHNCDECDDTVYINLIDKLPADDNVGPPELHKLKDALVKYAKKDGIAILVNLDVYSQNVKKLNVMFPADSDIIKVRNVYHVTDRKNVESILKNGLKARAIGDHSNSFQGDKVATYKAVFGVYQTGGIKEVMDFFRFDDPVVLKIKPKSYTWYDDPLMPMYVPSVMTYEDIKPEDISIK